MNKSTLTTGYAKQVTGKLITALAASAFIMACGQNPASLAGATNNTDNVSDMNGESAVVKSTVVLGKVGVLSKTSAISLKKLILTAVSTATPADTVRDTSTVSGSDQVTVLRTLTLKPLRTWSVSAKTMDLKDSVIHSGTSSAFFVKPADTVAVSLNLTSKFAMYQANFNTLPDSISSSQSGTGKDKLNVNRVVLKIDGVIKADSNLASGYFSGNQSVNIFFDYIAPGSHTVTLEAYGVLHSYSGILYSGSSTFSSTAGTDDTKAVTLGWVGPTTGAGSLTVILGKVGKVVVNGSLPGTIL